MLRRALVIAALAAGCSVGQPVASSRGAIVRGEDDAPESFAGVVRIGVGSASCTGTLIATDGDRGFVLTAAHCVMMPGQIFPTGVPASSITVYAGAEAGSAAPFGVTAVHVDPGYDLDRIDDPQSLDAWPSDIAHDFALLEIAGVDGALAAASIPWMTPADDHAVAGDPAWVAGYGQTDPDSWALARWRQRAAVSIFEIVPMLRTGTEKFVLNERQGLPGPCWGDSGGPLLLTDDLGAIRVGGVSSTLTTQLGGCDDLSYLGRVSAAADEFIAPTLAGAAPPPAACYACLYSASIPGGACWDELTADPASSSEFASCLQGRSFDACRADHVAGAAAYDAVWSCFENDACGAWCRDAHRTVQECRLGYDGAGPCDDCVRTSCCAAASSCQLDPGCSPCLSRLDADDATCLANPGYRAVRSCYDLSCRAECGPYVDILPTPPEPDGGAPDAGGPDPGDAGPVPTDRDAAVGDASTADGGLARDAGGRPEGGDGDGCSCRLAAPCPRGAGALPILLAILVARRTRRRAARAGDRAG